MRPASAAWLSRVCARHARASPPVPPRHLRVSRPSSSARGPLESGGAHPWFPPGLRPPLASATAEMDDYPVEEARVMRGDDDRIQPAVACAVAMGFGEADATEAAKRVIVAFPGRANVEELVVDALLADSGGGARAFELPKTMPRAYADGARAVPGTIADGSVEAAIDLTGEPSPDAPPAKRPRGGAAPEGKGKAPATDVVDDDDAKPANDANDLVRQLAAERHARDAARAGAADLAPDVAERHVGDGLRQRVGRLEALLVALGRDALELGHDLVEARRGVRLRIRLGLPVLGVFLRARFLLGRAREEGHRVMRL